MTKDDIYSIIGEEFPVYTDIHFAGVDSKLADFVIRCADGDTALYDEFCGQMLAKFGSGGITQSLLYIRLVEELLTGPHYVGRPCYFVWSYGEDEDDDIYYFDGEGEFYFCDEDHFENRKRLNLLHELWKLTNAKKAKAAPSRSRKI